MIIINEGNKPITDGFHLINAHADSPCLKIKPRPLRVKWDLEDIYNYLGVRLSTIPHGGIVVPHWVGQPVQIMGYTINKNGTRREIKFPGFVGVNSAHVDYSEQEPVEYSFAPEKSLEVITGYSNIQHFFKDIKFETADDFANTQLWAVPVNQMIPVDTHSCNLLVGYGHDDRTGVFSTVDAIIKTKNPEYTSIAWISDNEEIGEPSPAGTSGPFFRMLLEKMIEKQEKKEDRKISNLERYKMYCNSKMIIGDVTIAPYGIDSNNMDHKSSAKIGLGVAINGGDIQGNNPYFVRYLRNLISEKKICHQLCGQFYHQDIMGLWCSDEQDYKSPISEGIPQIWVGVPCASCHSTVEIICPGDEYATFQLYKKFFESE
jgi:aspartyl aminopeptidase